MQCPECEHTVDQSDKFCRNCGASLAPEAGRAPGDARLASSATMADLASEYAAALVDAPKDATAQYNLALAMLYQGKYSQAATHLFAVVENEPEFTDAYEKLAIALQKLGDTAGAVTALKGALGLDPENDRLRAALDRLSAS